MTKLLNIALMGQDFYHVIIKVLQFYSSAVEKENGDYANAITVILSCSRVNATPGAKWKNDP
jgi:hypothetical protein